MLVAGALLFAMHVMPAIARDDTLPTWARSAFTRAATQRGIVRRVQSSKKIPAMVRGDFDGDGHADIALLVEQRTSHKIGIVILHDSPRAAALFGAGVKFGNGGDDFEWMDHWTIAKVDSSRSDALLVEREESGGGLIVFVRGAYHWRQRGD